MGYTTNFTGSIAFNRPLTHQDWLALKKIHDDYKSPDGAPNSYNHWEPNDEGDCLQWDGGEKFYLYEEWLKWLIDNFFKPRGYALNGTVKWQGEETGDVGKIIVIDSQVSILKVDLDTIELSEAPLKLYELMDGDERERSCLVFAHTPIEAAKVVLEEDLEEGESLEELLIRSNFLYAEIPVKAGEVGSIDWTEPEELFSPDKKLNDMLTDKAA